MAGELCHSVILLFNHSNGAVSALGERRLTVIDTRIDVLTRVQVFALLLSLAYLPMFLLGIGFLMLLIGLGLI